MMYKGSRQNGGWTHHKSSPEQLARQVLITNVPPLVISQTNIVQAQQVVH